MRMDSVEAMKFINEKVGRRDRSGTASSVVPVPAFVVQRNFCEFHSQNTAPHHTTGC